MQHDGGRLAFQETTDRIIQALGIRTGKQRLDSTHIMSNIATLSPGWACSVRRYGCSCGPCAGSTQSFALGFRRAC